jgi:adenylate kinase family enzyme
MQRIVIFGAPGSGKSTLAGALGERLGLPVIYLDALFYRPDWAEGDAEVFRTRLTAAMDGGCWISEGNFIAKTAEMRLPMADTVIWIEQPRWLSCWRTIVRGVKAETGRADQAPGCRNSIDRHLLRFIWNFDATDRPEIDAAIALWALHASVIRLRGDAAIRGFLNTVGSEA